MTVVDFPAHNDVFSTTAGLAMEFMGAAAAAILVVRLDQANNKDALALLRMVASHPHGPAHILVVLTHLDNFITTTGAPRPPPHRGYEADPFDGPAASKAHGGGGGAPAVVADIDRLAMLLRKKLDEVEGLMSSTVGPEVTLTLLPITFNPIAAGEPPTTVATLQALNTHFVAAGEAAAAGAAATGAPWRFLRTLQLPGLVEPKKAVIFSTNAVLAWMAERSVEWAAAGVFPPVVAAGDAGGAEAAAGGAGGAGGAAAAAACAVPALDAAARVD